MTKVQFKVENEIIPLNGTVLTNLPRDSLLYNLIYNEAFAKEQDEEGNFVLLNQDITPKIFQMIAEYVEFKDIATLMIKSYSCRIPLLGVMDYLGIPVPSELGHTKDLQDLLDIANINDKARYKQLRDKIFRNNFHEFNNCAKTLVSALLKKHKEIYDSECVTTCERVAFQISADPYGCDFDVQITYKLLGVVTKLTIDYPRKFDEQSILLTDIFLNVIWGLGLSYREIEKINSRQAFLTASQIFK
ncbi:hypothetical protein HDV04_005122 [Boothiomyces sp. JEL0838]|nr:hypothetical protein HDV04_005122 [Boothiomyces sp. JEL0838]